VLYLEESLLQTLTFSTLYASEKQLLVCSKQTRWERTPRDIRVSNQRGVLFNARQ